MDSATNTTKPKEPLSLPRGVALPTSLEHARIASLPPSAYYIPDFISEEEERHILDKVLEKSRFSTFVEKNLSH